MNDVHLSIRWKRPFFGGTCSLSKYVILANEQQLIKLNYSKVDMDGILVTQHPLFPTGALRDETKRD